MLRPPAGKKQATLIHLISTMTLSFATESFTKYFESQAVPIQAEKLSLEDVVVRKEVRHDRVPDIGAMPKGLRVWVRTVQLH